MKTQIQFGQVVGYAGRCVPLDPSMRRRLVLVTYRFAMRQPSGPILLASDRVELDRTTQV
jgi:hypothetical protein